MAIQTIYRELDRAKALVKKHAKRDEEPSDFDEDWTLVEDDAAADTSSFEIQYQPSANVGEGLTDASRGAGGSLAFPSMVVKGANDGPDTAFREG